MHHHCSYRAVTASLRSKLSKHSLQTCISVVILAFASVMAGTGELNLLRRLRVMHGQVGATITYGTHMASHLALGLLFLGKGRYTLGTSKLATAALLCAFYPVFPSIPSCNRFHLQALRHLWVLAVEPRCLIAKDVDSGKAIYVPLKFRVREGGDKAEMELRSKKLTTPTLIPPLHTIDSIRTNSPRYWPVTLNFANSKQHLDSFLRGQTLFVKRKPGHLSYAHDARGIRSIFTQAKVESGSNVLDEGSSGRLFLAGADSFSGIISAYTTHSSVARTDHRFFLLAEEHDLASTKQMSDFYASAMMECLVQDKSEAVPVYRAIYAALLAATSATASSSSMQSLQELMLVIELYGGSLLSQLGAIKPRPPLVNSSLLNALQHRLLASAEQSVEAEGASIQQYLANGQIPASAQTLSSLNRIIVTLGIPPAEVVQELGLLTQHTMELLEGAGAQNVEQILHGVLERALGKVAEEAGRPSDVSNSRVAGMLLRRWV